MKRPQLYAALCDLGVPPKLVRLIKITMDDTRCTVRVQSDLSPEFVSRRGVRQGDGLAGLLFNLALKKVIRDSGIQTADTIFNRLTQILGFADDLDLVARSFESLKNAFIRLAEAAEGLGMSVNPEKTVYMRAGPETDTAVRVPVLMGPFTFENVGQFTYLGAVVSCGNRISLEVNQRIIRANRCYFGLSKHLRSSAISLHTKCLVYKTLIRPVLTYGSESWTVSRKEEKDLKGSQMPG